MNDDLLLDMYDEGYYAEHLIDRLKQLLNTDFAASIAKIKIEADIYHHANEVIRKINKLKPLFEEAECELDGVAADHISEAMMMILQDAGYFDIDQQELLAAKEW